MTVKYLVSLIKTLLECSCLQTANEEAYTALTELYLKAVFPFLNAVFLLFFQNNISTLSAISAEYLWS